MQGWEPPPLARVLEVYGVETLPRVVLALYLDDVEDDSFTLSWPVDRVELIDAA